MGDINILDHEEMIWSYFLLMVAVLWYAFIMAEYTAVLVVYDELQTEFFILVAAQRSYLQKMGHKDLMSRVTQAEEMRYTFFSNKFINTQAWVFLKNEAHC